MKCLAITLMFLFVRPIFSQDVIDCIMDPGSCPGVKFSLLQLTTANDSLSKVYINKLMNYLENEAVDGFNSGYTTAKVREYMRIGTDFNNDKSRYVPKGVIAMYLIYSILLKDSAFCNKIVITKKNKNQINTVAFYKLNDNIYGDRQIGKFIGRRHLKKMAKIFKKWHKNHSAKTILELSQNLPFKGTAYDFKGLKY